MINDPCILIYGVDIRFEYDIIIVIYIAVLMNPKFKSFYLAQYKISIITI